jgi:hypothetical protein
MHHEIRLDRFVGQMTLPEAQPKNFALAQRADDPPALFSLLTSFPRKATEEKGDLTCQAI